MDGLIFTSIVGITVFGLALYFFIFQVYARVEASSEAPKGSHQISVNGVELFYHRQGRGPALLLLHGIGASTYSWRFQIPTLSPQFDVIALDLPGFGRSQKQPDFDYSLDWYSDIVDQFLHAIHVESCFITGSSMGGTIALNLLRKFPMRVKKIAALAPATDPRLVPPGLRALLPAAGVMRSLLNERIMAQIMARVNARKTLIVPEAIAESLSPFRSDPHSVVSFLKATRAIRDPRLPSLFQRLDPDRVLLIYGEKDRMVPRRSMNTLSRILNTPIYAHPEAGHHPHEDEPEWINHLLIDFFLAPKGRFPQNPV